MIVINGDKHEDKILYVGNSRFLKWRYLHGNPIRKELRGDSQENTKEQNHIEVGATVMEHIVIDLNSLVFEEDDDEITGKADEGVVEL